MEKEIHTAKIYGTLHKVSDESLASAYEMGMLRKEDLKDNTYYQGYCRNARVALWKAEANLFIHQRYKHGSYYAESIVYPSDDQGFDIFTPIEIAVPKPEEVVSEADVADIIQRYLK